MVRLERAAQLKGRGTPEGVLEVYSKTKPGFASDKDMGGNSRKAGPNGVCDVYSIRQVFLVRILVGLPSRLNWFFFFQYSRMPSSPSLTHQSISSVLSPTYS